MGLTLLVTDKGREALREVIDLANYRYVLVGKFRAASDYYGAGATDADKRTNFQGSTLTSAEYINKVEGNDDSVTFYCNLYPPTQTTNPMAAVALYYKLMSQADVDYYQANPTLNPYDDIDETDADNIFGIAYFASSTEAIPADIMQRMMMKFTFTNGTVASAIYEFNPNQELDQSQDDVLLSMVSSFAESNVEMVQDINEIEARLDELKSDVEILSSAVSSVSAFNDSFNNTTDWTDDGTNYYIDFTHNLSSSGIIYQLWEDIGGSQYQHVLPQDAIQTSVDNLRIKVSKTPDERFTGLIKIIKI